jgi:hypothetical protein
MIGLFFWDLEFYGESKKSEKFAQTEPPFLLVLPRTNRNGARVSSKFGRVSWLQIYIPKGGLNTALEWGKDRF